MQPTITEIHTEREDVILRELATDADDIAFFKMVDANRDHLSQLGDRTASTYPDLESVRQARLLPLPPGILRFGIWVDNTMVGATTMSPFESGVELGSFTDSRHTGKGYAMVARRALIAFARSQGYSDIFAETADENMAVQKMHQRLGSVRRPSIPHVWIHP